MIRSPLHRPLSLSVVACVLAGAVDAQKAPEVTRDRLYLEAVESVLANTSKVLIDVPGGNNLMYLPLDRLMESRGDEGGGEQPGFGIDDASVPRAVLEDPRRSRSSLRGRNR